ncbi:hypothetical protein GRAN_3033 [Granulicella sibirica]|uniref:Uncharacterized protein n=1 Tax=Granulicella sibirica TaxID=2479048 RepID=A0A4Q0T3R8_9BACT|nr:hypothetical protein GRAN_3033 [Granulicella sibirica]
MIGTDKRRSRHLTIAVEKLTYRDRIDSLAGVPALEVLDQIV